MYLNMNRLKIAPDIYNERVDVIREFFSLGGGAD
jgi:hypothetical protein